MTDPAKKQDEPMPPSPHAHGDFVQDRALGAHAGAKKGWRNRDGLAYMLEKREINAFQLRAGRRLQEDYQKAHNALFPKSGNERNGGSGARSAEVSDNAMDAKDRVKRALAVLTPEILSMTVLWLFPHQADAPLSYEQIAVAVSEDKRAVPLGIRTALSLLARHYED